MSEDRDEGGEAPHSEGERKEEEHRGRVGLLSGLLRKAISQGVDALSDEKIKETLIAEVLRKAINKGGEVYEGTEDSLRKLISDLPLPKEVVDRLMARVDDYKGDLLRLVGTEVHDFLDRVDIGHEVQKVLTSLSFEITTEIRFIPNEKGLSPLRPDVKAGLRVKRARGKRRAASSEEPEEE